MVGNLILCILCFVYTHKGPWGLLPLQMVTSAAGGLLAFGDEYTSICELLTVGMPFILAGSGEWDPQGSSPYAVGGISLSLAFSVAVSFPHSSAAKNLPAVQEMQV